MLPYITKFLKTYRIYRTCIRTSAYINEAEDVFIFNISCKYVSACQSVSFKVPVLHLFCLRMDKFNIIVKKHQSKCYVIDCELTQKFYFLI